MLDQDQLTQHLHTLMLEIATKLERKASDLGHDTLQNYGYPDIEEGFGKYRFNPAVQEHMTTLLVKHLLSDDGLSLDGKITAVRLAVLHTAPQHLYIENEEELKKSEFPAFLDHFTKFSLKLERGLLGELEAEQLLGAPRFKRSTF